MFKKMTSILLILTLLGIPEALASKVQQQGIVTAADCASRSVANGVCLPLTDQIYDSTNGQQLSASISGGLLGGGGGGAAIELLTNTGFESGLSGYTASGGTASTVTSGSNLIAGSKTASWVASASAQTFSSAAMTIKGLAGGQCSAQLYYIYGGTAGDYTFQVLDGSSNILASTSLGVQSLANTPTLLSFPCGGATTSTLTWQVKSNVASPSTIYMDVLHMGSLTVQQVSQAQLYGSAIWPQVSGCTWSGVAQSSYSADYSAQSSCTSPTGSNLIGQAQAPSTNIPAITFANMPSGTYVLQATGGFQISDAGGNFCSYAFYDGTSSGIGPASGTIASQNVFGSSVTSVFTYAAGQTNKTFSIRGRNSSATTGCAINDSSPSIDGLQISVFFYPTASTSTVSVGQQPQSWSGYYTANGVWTSGTSGSFSDFTGGGSNVLTQRTNVNFGTVTQSSTLPSFVFTPTTASTYFICATGSLSASGGSTSGAVQIVDGSGTVVSTMAANAISTSTAQSFSMCGNYQAKSVSPVTIKLQGAAQSSESAIINYTGGISNILEWSIVNIGPSLGAAQFNGPGSVTSTSAGQEHIERVSVNSACSSSPCTISSQSGSWLSSLTRTGTGNYELNFSAGEFSATPTCTCLAAQNDVCGSSGGMSNTSFNILVTQSNNLVLVDQPFQVICMGPH